MYCGSCGTPLNGDARFCPGCGVEVAWDQGEEYQQEQVASVPDAYPDPAAFGAGGHGTAGDTRGVGYAGAAGFPAADYPGQVTDAGGASYGPGTGYGTGVPAGYGPADYDPAAGYGAGAAASYDPADYDPAAGYPRSDATVSGRPGDGAGAPARFGPRVVARLLDLALVALVSALVIGLLLWLFLRGRSFSELSVAALATVVATPVALWLLYRLFCDASTAGQTIGKSVVGLRVEDLSGGRAGWRRSLVRTVVEVLADIPVFLGSLWALWGPDARTVGDMASGTRVGEARQSGAGLAIGSAAAAVACLAILVAPAGAAVIVKHPAPSSSPQAAASTGAPTAPGSGSPTPSTAPSPTPSTSPSGSYASVSPSGLVTTADGVGGPATAALLSTLDKYFSGINSADYDSAWSTYSPTLQAKVGGRDKWEDGISGTTESDVVVQQQTPNSAKNGDQATLELTFTSNQPGDEGPNPGETCTNWTLDYDMTATGGDDYTINSVKHHGNTPEHTGC